MASQRRAAAAAAASAAASAAAAGPSAAAPSISGASGPRSTSESLLLAQLQAMGLPLTEAQRALGSALFGPGADLGAGLSASAAAAAAAAASGSAGAWESAMHVLGRLNAAASSGNPSRTSDDLMALLQSLSGARAEREERERPPPSGVLCVHCCVMLYCVVLCCGVLCWACFVVICVGFRVEVQWQSVGGCAVCIV
jgi:hypothetical protein